MLRFVLITALIGYILYKLGFFRPFTHPGVRGDEPHRNFSKKPPGGNVNIDSVPGQDKNGEKKRSGYKGGEYVDYEEVK
jgi:hypothetical protein